MAGIVTLVKCLFIVTLLIEGSVAPPTKVKNETAHEKEKEMTMDDLGLEYNRYLKEVVDALESDKEFAKKLQSASDVDFRTGKVAQELEFVSHHVRTKLDELKRTELQRLRELVAMLDEQEHKKSQDEMHAHLDHSNPHTFEVADLQNLIVKVKKDLDEADRLRRENFKEYELQKEFEKEQKIKTMEDEHAKEEYLKKLEEDKKKHQKHDPIHHPGGQAQLEEVWEKTDHMEDVKFNPKAFFYMHDLDSNGYWDEQEVNALFLRELNKMYEAGAPEDDMREREEEMERMREHVFSETDTNHDRLISLQEFIEQTKRQEFKRDDGWETLDEKPQFSREEYLEFEKRRQAEIDDMIQKGLLQPYPPGMHLDHLGQIPPGGVPQYGQHPNQGYGQHPNQGYGQHPNQMPQYQNQVPQHPNQMPQYQNIPQGGQHPNSQYHPNQIPQHHNQVPQHPNQVPQHPNQVPQHPNQVPQHPNQVPQHPNQVPQHPNQIPQHPNQVPQYPNQVPQHPNQVPQHPNQIPQYNQQPQVPQHPNQANLNQNINQGQIPQNSNQAPHNPQAQNPPQSNQIQHDENKIPQPVAQQNQGYGGSQGQQYQQPQVPQQQYQAQVPQQQYQQPQVPQQQSQQQYQQNQQNPPQGQQKFDTQGNKIGSDEKLNSKP